MAGDPVPLRLTRTLEKSALMPSALDKIIAVEVERT
jgi:hypothetical protein